MTSVQGSNDITSQFIAGSDVHFDYEKTDGTNSVDTHLLNNSNKKKKKKKKKNSSTRVKTVNSDSDYPTSRIITGGPQNSVIVSPMDSNTVHKKKRKDSHHNDDIWESSIDGQKLLKEFWLTLLKDEQRKLVSISKENVLQAIRDNDKVNCDCSLCGRKRNAIEKELEVMYESYYDTFNETMSHQTDNLSDAYLNDAAFVDSLFNPLGNNNDGIMSIAEDLLSNNGTKFLDIMEKLAERRMAREDYQHKQDHIHHYQGHPITHEDVEDSEGIEELCSECGQLEYEYQVEDEDDEEEEDEDEDQNHDHDHEHDHDHFCPHHHIPQDYHYRNKADLGRQIPATQAEINHHYEDSAEEYEEDDDEDDEEELDDEEDDEEDDDDLEDDLDDLDDGDYDENDSIDEERRFEEARRMIQLFTTRMFHDRLLERYRLKVANDRSNKLLEELEQEELKKKEKEEKKQKLKEKLKEKKRLQQLAKEEERAKKELERQENERKLQEEKERRAEEQRKKEEEKRKKKLEEQKKKQAELEKLKKEKLEKERLKKEEKQRKKEEEKRKREEELLIKKHQEDEELQKEMERQLEQLQNFQMSEQQIEADQKLKELELKQSYDSKQLLESLYKQESTPSPILPLNGAQNPSLTLPSFSQFNLTNPQQMIPGAQQRQMSQTDFNSLPKLDRFSPPQPPPGIHQTSSFNNVMPPPLQQHHNLLQTQHLPDQQQLHMTQIPQQSLPLPQVSNTLDSWSHQGTKLDGSSNNLFDSAALPATNVATNGFPSMLDNTRGLTSNLSNPSFNTFPSLIKETNNLENGFNTNVNGFNDNWGKSDFWMTPEVSRVEMNPGFGMRSNSIWNGSTMSSPPQLQNLLSLQLPQQKPMMTPLNNESRSGSVPTNLWTSNTAAASEELSPATITLIQEAVAQSYQQLFTLGSNWVSRNTLFNQAQVMLSSMLNLTLSMFLKSITSPNLSYWFEIHYDEYGAASMVRVGQKDTSTLNLNNNSFQPFNSDEISSQLGKNVFLSQPSFGNSVPTGLEFTTTTDNNVANGSVPNEPLYNLWNSSNFTLL